MFIQLHNVRVSSPKNCTGRLVRQQNPPTVFFKRQSTHVTVTVTPSLGWEVGHQLSFFFRILPTTYNYYKWLTGNLVVFKIIQSMSHKKSLLLRQFSNEQTRIFCINIVKSKKQTPGAGEVAQGVNTLATQTSWPDYDPWTHIRKLDVIARICNPSTPAGKQKAESHPEAGGSATLELVGQLPQRMQQGINNRKTGSTRWRKRADSPKLSSDLHTLTVVPVQLHAHTHIMHSCIHHAHTQTLHAHTYAIHTHLHHAHTSTHNNK